MIDRSQDWLILRTTPSSTVRLAESLAEAGFECWTPISMQTKRVSRSRNRKEVSVPVTPGFVFVRYDRKDELIALSRSPSHHLVWDASLRRMVAKGYPYFTVFRYLDTYPWIADRELDPLRLEEQRAKPKAKAPAFKAGAKVKHPESGFEGLVGTVQGSKGKFALVLFPGFRIPVHIRPWQLVAC